MSSVNDALKRGAKSEPKIPHPAIHPPLRNPHRTPHARNQDIMFSILVVLILCIGGIFLWQWSHGGNELIVRARTYPRASGITATSQIPDTATSAVAEVPIKMIPVGPQATSSVAQQVVPDSSAPAYKLQSILYVPGNPSAIINGKTVHINGSVNDARVTAIGPGTATIITPQGEKMVLAIANP